MPVLVVSCWWTDPATVTLVSGDDSPDYNDQSASSHLLASSFVFFIANPLQDTRKGGKSYKKHRARSRDHVIPAYGVSLLLEGVPGVVLDLVFYPGDSKQFS